MKHQSLLFLQVVLLLAKDHIAHTRYVLASWIVAFFESYVIGYFLPWASLDYTSLYIVLVLSLEVVGILSIDNPISLHLL
jgi:hypothetical protein